MGKQSLIRTKSGNKVQSISEAKIDNYLFESGYHPIYEPTIEMEDWEFKPDWVILPQKSLDKPLIIEYWGLLRKENRARWVIDRLPHYLARKEIKENIYESDERYHFLGIYPEQLDDLDVVLGKFLNNGVTSLKL